MLFCRLLIVFFFFKIIFKNNSLKVMSSECHTDWIQIRPQPFVGPDLDPNCLQRLSADHTSRQRVNGMPGDFLPFSRGRISVPFPFRK